MCLGKLVQLAQLPLGEAPPDDPRVMPLVAQLFAKSAITLAEMSNSASTARQARSHLDRARDGYEPLGSHAQAAMNLAAAQVHLRLGSFDTAEAMAFSAVRTFGASSLRACSAP